VNNRVIDGNILTLAISGWLYDLTFVLWDYDTGSMWFPVTNGNGETRLLCISGEYAGRKLQLFSHVETTWDKWKQSNPDTKILAGSGGCCGQ
jgi:hypothetical protein